MAPLFVRSTIREMEGYIPGEQPGAAQRVVKLNTNENPYLPSDRVMKAIASVTADSLRRYPNPNADVFRDAAAKLHGVTRQHIIAGNGSDDILAIAMGCFLPPGGKLAYPEPTYSLYPVLAAIGECVTMSVAWDRDWSLPIERLIATGANAIFLANPNAPSGTFVSPAKIAELAKKFSGVLLIDEAYADFAQENCVSLVKEFPNVVVTRTLSKAYSLAGLRLGYAIAQPAVIDEMMKVKQSYNCDAISLVAGAAALEDQQHGRLTWEKIKSERARVTEELTRAGWIIPPSQANFILATVPGGEGREIYLGLKEQGILVRFFDLPGLRDKVRVTIGQSHENNALLAAIKKLATAGKAA